MTAGPTGGKDQSEPTDVGLRPAKQFLEERQTITGANAASRSESDTSVGAPPKGTAAGAGGGGKSPAPSSAASGEDKILEAIGKMNARLDAQGQFLQKVQGTLAQTRQEFETRYSGGRRSAEGDDLGLDETPPKFDTHTIIQSVTKGVMAQLGEQLRPLVEQTASNSAAQRVMQAQMDPGVKQMVDELPPQVRTTLAREVHRMVGDKMFAEPDPMFDTPDPVSEAIEMIHYRTVVKTQGRRAGARQPEAREELRQPFTPVPTTGTRSEADETPEDEQLAEQLFNIKLGKDRTRFPAAVERSLGMS